MNVRLTATICALSLLAGSLASAAPPAAGNEPQVMILGTFHFQGSATDAISVTMGDVLAPDRQAEIEQVVERLAAFSPTKIMVEHVPEQEPELNATYRAHLPGEHSLTSSETEQIAMRLARKLGHQKLWAVDHRRAQPEDLRQHRPGDRRARGSGVGGLRVGRRSKCSASRNDCPTVSSPPPAASGRGWGEAVPTGRRQSPPRSR